MKNEITLSQQGEIAIIEFSPGHRHNPFSSERMNRLEVVIKDLAKNSNIKAAILYGGKDNSFSVGGDFNEVSNFTGGSEVEKWLDDVTNLYKAVLSLPKPIIAAIDNYAIGFGLQLALTCDYRIGSDSCELKMPEFAMGIACNFGGYMLEHFVNRSTMQYMLFNCDAMHADEAKDRGLLHETIGKKELLDHAIMIAKKFAIYPSIPVEETKNTINHALIKGLDNICLIAKNAHKKSFATGAAQEKMRKIIK